ncbi:hypothetical protein MA16_Dca014957 [Dendrobium catenatum]|uniref:Uncharacterized protein n=1 Tax=Dendrobium catenatum TaxID=906689 RepID=A0A2I0V9I6_9ASPA|nr:hypothetical protein MA16_Dca014957 [Dendrobium catenatum]
MTKIPLWGSNRDFKPNELQIERNHLQQVSNIISNLLDPFPTPGSTWLTKSTGLTQEAL